MIALWTAEVDFAPPLWHAESPAGALVKALVPLELDPARLPKFYRLLKARAPDDLSTNTIRGEQLPKTDWMHDQIATRTIGDEWLASKNGAILRVPSAVVPETLNVLLNPEHAD